MFLKTLILNSKCEDLATESKQLIWFGYQALWVQILDDTSGSTKDQIEAKGSVVAWSENWSTNDTYSHMQLEAITPGRDSTYSRDWPFG